MSSIRRPDLAKTRSLATAEPEITLAPYQEELRPYGQLQEGDLNRATISSIDTEYKGKAAQNITFDISQGVHLDPLTEYPYPINVNEEGELIHFSVSVNDENMFVVCILYDSENRATVICNDNMLSLARKGKGLTVAEAIAVDNNGISLDKGGRAHNVASYLSRSKHTFSFGHLSDPYDLVEGTNDDKYYVIEYSPLVPHPYQRIYFTIQNQGNDGRLIHEATVKRIAYVDKYDMVVENPEDKLLAQKARIKY